MAYIYQADVYCDSCGQTHRDYLTMTGQAPDNPDDESTYASDVFPKDVSDDEESDTPQHCASGKNCLQYEETDGDRVGYFFRNNLTEAGKRYVQEQHRDNGSAVTQMWMDFYGFDPLGPERSEDDYTTKDYVSFYQYGKIACLVVGADAKWQDVVRRDMEIKKCWPNVWYIGERGDENLLDMETGGFAK